MVIAGVNPPLGSPTSRWYHRAIAQGSCLQVQLRKDDLPKVLRPTTTASHQLPKEEMRSHQPASTKEEDKVNDLSTRCFYGGRICAWIQSYDIMEQGLPTLHLDMES